MAFAQVPVKGEIAASAFSGVETNGHKLSGDLSGLPLRRETEPAAGANGIGGFQVLTALLLLLLFAGVVIWRRRHAAPSQRPDGMRQWLGWLRPAATPGTLRLIQSVRLTPSASAHVLRWNGQELLVGCSEHGLSVLAQRPQPEDAAELAPGAVSALRDLKDSV